jgi:hypothetical protein
VTDFSFAQWLMSPGFGGTAAVVAAGIAWAGVNKSVKAQRQVNRKQQWWERARWALDLTLNDDSITRAVGFEVLDALANSEWATEHETDVIDAAVAATLDGYDSADIDDTTGNTDNPQAHLGTDPEAQETSDG